MKVSVYICAISGIIFNAVALPEDIQPPDVQAHPFELTAHGDVRIDEYYWLRNIDNPAVITYLEEENAYTEEMMAHTDDLREEIYNEILARMPQEYESVPYFRNGYYYYTVYEQDKVYPIYMRREGNLESPEELVLDVNLLADGHPYFNVTEMSVSPDNRILAFSVDTMGNHHCTILFKDLITGEMLDDMILNTSEEIVWANDSRTFFFGRLRDSQITERIMRRELGSTEEVTVLYEEDPSYWPYVYESRSEDYILLCVYKSYSPSEFWFLDADNPEGDFTVIQPRTNNLSYIVCPSEEQFYILTNLEARNNRLMTTDIESPSMENWVEVIPNRRDVILEWVDLFGGFMVLTERKDGLTMLRVIDFENNIDYYLDFDDKIYFVRMGDNYVFDTDLFRFEYESMVTPRSTFDYNIVTHESTLLKQQEIPNGYDAALYHSEELWAPIESILCIQITLVYRKDLFRAGKNPLLLHGYGAYGTTLVPNFDVTRLSLLDRGFVYAIAHVRGGGSIGNIWHNSGALLNKINTFTDFIACAEYLIDEGYCNKDLLFAEGSSAGGLLMGAVVNMRPDLWRGVIAGTPFVDVVTSMLDETIPLTIISHEEWGNPNDPVYYEYMLSYSPYDNVRGTDYPAMLVYTGLNDSNVGCWEAAKWVARLRDIKTDDNPLLLYTDMESGHRGASGTYQWIDLVSLIYAFILDQAGY